MMTIEILQMLQALSYECFKSQRECKKLVVKKPLDVQSLFTRWNQAGCIQHGREKGMYLRQYCSELGCLYFVYHLYVTDESPG